MSFNLLCQQMVKSQLMPEGVGNENILEAFSKIPRELFVPQEKKEFAYQDQAIRLTEDRFLMRPALLARLFEAAHFKKTDRVLYLGALTGYGPAILSQLVQEIVAVEADPFLFSDLQHNLAQLKITNVTALKGDLKGNYALPGRYDGIFIEGAVTEIPEGLIQQLNPNGFVLAIVQEDEREGKAVKWHSNEGSPYEQELFFATANFLKNFKTKERFVF